MLSVLSACAACVARSQTMQLTQDVALHRVTQALLVIQLRGLQRGLQRTHAHIRKVLVLMHVQMLCYKYCGQSRLFC